jgi:hypothetical protein
MHFQLTPILHDRLDVIGAGSTPAAGNKDWNEIWRLSPQAAKIKRDIQDLSKPAPGSVGNPGHTDTEYATSFLAQTWLVCKRTTLAYYRSPTYGYTRVINHILVALWQGLFFLNIGNSRTDLQYRIFSVSCYLIFLFALTAVFLLTDVLY